MAASSPVVSDKSSIGAGIGGTASPASSTRSISAQRPDLLEPPKQNLRGLNKPKCIKCGNIARARCPYQSCKGCCVKAENPCHIHVLKHQPSILPDMPPPSPAPSSSEQPPSMTSSTGAASRLSSLRQLSNAFANSLRTKRPLSRKDAININKWRFAKLREHMEGDIEIENEAFDRYMWNVSLLEEVIFPSKMQDHFTADGLPSLEQLVSNEFEKTVCSIKARLQSKLESTSSTKEKIRDIVDQGLKKLWRPGFEDDDSDEDNDDELAYNDDLTSYRERKIRKKIIDLREERNTAISDLLDKLKKARSVDDLKSCLQIKHQLFNLDGNASHFTGNLQIKEDAVDIQRSSNFTPSSYSYLAPELFTRVQIDQDTLLSIEAQSASVDGIVKL